MTFTKDNYFEIHPNSLFVLIWLLRGSNLTSTYRSTFHEGYLSIPDKRVPEDEIPGICQELLEYDLLESYEISNQKDYRERIPTGTFLYKCNLKGRRYVEYYLEHSDQIYEESIKENQDPEDVKLLRKICDEIKSPNFDITTINIKEKSFTHIGITSNGLECDLDGNIVTVVFLPSDHIYYVSINNGNLMIEGGKEIYNILEGIYSLQKH